MLPHKAGSMQKTMGRSRVAWAGTRKRTLGRTGAPSATGIARTKGASFECFLFSLARGSVSRTRAFPWFLKSFCSLAEKLAISFAIFPVYSSCLECASIDAHSTNTHTCGNTHKALQVTPATTPPLPPLPTPLSLHHTPTLPPSSSHPATVFPHVGQPPSPQSLTPFPSELDLHRFCKNEKVSLFL